MTDVLPVFLALIGVVALMCGAMYLLKWFTRRISFGNSGGKGIKIITSAAVGQDKSVAVVRAGKKCLLVGVTNGGINVLCELDDADMEMISGSESDNTDMAGRPFSECLRYNLKKAGADFIRPVSEDASADDENADN